KKPLLLIPNQKHPTDETDPWRIFRIMTEFVTGFEFIGRFKKSVTIFGSARLPSTSPTYQQALKLSEMLSRKGYAIITGGGPGIMEAANQGADIAGGDSIGIAVKLEYEKDVNK